MQSHHNITDHSQVSQKELSASQSHHAPRDKCQVSQLYSLRCEDLAEIIWINRQQIRQLEMIHEGLNIPNQETSMNILPELSDGLNVLLDQLVKSSFVIEKQPPQVIGRSHNWLTLTQFCQFVVVAILRKFVSHNN